MQNCFLIVPFACLCYIAHNLILYRKYGTQIVSHKFNFKRNLLQYGIILLLILTFQLLNIHNFVSDNFSYDAVYKYSEKSIPCIYKITSSFSNKSGAFLLWLTCIVCVGFAFTNKINKELTQPRLVYLLQAVSMVLPLLLALMLFFTDAFGQTGTAVALNNGIGFKPILYNKYNIFHAPLLFAGFAFYYHIYVLAICSLFDKSDLHCSFNELYINLLAKYNKVGLLLLFSGTLLGAAWAYDSFGWGGFWNWDPIENAALILLLLSLALLQMFEFTPSQKSYKLILFVSLLIFPMLLLCTFLARGGASLTAAMQSIHSYAETNYIELLFILGFLLLILMGSVLLFIIKSCRIANNEIDNSNLKTIILFEIIILSGIAFVVFVGTCLPLFSGLVGFDIPSISSSFYIMWCRPLVSIFLILSSIKALTYKDKFWQIKFSGQTVFSFVFALIATIFANFNHIWQATELLLIFACSLTLASHLLALLQHIRPVGTILVHTGIAILVLAALLQSHFTVEEKVILIENQKCKTNTGIVCTFNEIMEEKLSNFNLKVSVNISVLAKNTELKLNPNFIVSNNNIINFHSPDYARHGITDIYIQPLACYENSSGKPVLVADIIVKPFMVFVWIGGAIVLLGLLLALFEIKR